MPNLLKYEIRVKRKRGKHTMGTIIGEGITFDDVSIWSLSILRLPQI